MRDRPSLLEVEKLPNEVYSSIKVMQIGKVSEAGNTLSLRTKFVWVQGKSWNWILKAIRT